MERFNLPCYLLSVFLFIGHALGQPSMKIVLPQVVFADTEITTNVPFAASLDTAGIFSLEFALYATPSNNVEVAFGVDANRNGILELEEIDRVIGWDCGIWFTRIGADGPCRMEKVDDDANGLTTSERTISWKVQVGTDGLPSQLEVVSNDIKLFKDMPLESIYNPSWNLIRLTGRGTDMSIEDFMVSVAPDGLVFILK